MSWFWDEDADVLTRCLTASAAGAVLGFGTCGVSAIAGAGESKVLGVLAVIGAGTFFLSVSVLVLSLLALFVRAIVNVFRGH